MVALILSLLGSLRSALRTRAELALENLALRQQLINLRRTSSRARLRNCDRAFWLVLSRFWSRWADALVVVKPDTVLRWHRAGFRLFWRWKSRSHGPAEGSAAPEVRLGDRGTSTWPGSAVPYECLIVGPLPARSCSPGSAVWPSRSKEPAPGKSHLRGESGGSCQAPSRQASIAPHVVVERPPPPPTVVTLVPAERSRLNRTLLQLSLPVGER